MFGIENLDALPTTEEDEAEMDEFFSNLVNQKESQMSKEQERLQKESLKAGIHLVEKQKYLSLKDELKSMDKL